MIAVRQRMVVVVLEKSTEITSSFTIATSIATATTSAATTATTATITPTTTTIVNNKSKGTTSPPLPFQNIVTVIFLIRNYIPSLISPFAITTTAITLHITDIATLYHIIDNNQ